MENLGHGGPEGLQEGGFTGALAGKVILNGACSEFLRVQKRPSRIKSTSTQGTLCAPSSLWLHLSKSSLPLSEWSKGPDVQGDQVTAQSPAHTAAPGKVIPDAVWGKIHHRFHICSPRDWHSRCLLCVFKKNLCSHRNKNIHHSLCNPQPVPLHCTLAALKQYDSVANWARKVCKTWPWRI